MKLTRPPKDSRLRQSQTTTTIGGEVKTRVPPVGVAESPREDFGALVRLDRVPLLLLFEPHETLGRVPDLVPALLYGEMPNEVLARYTELPVLAEAANEAFPFRVLAEREQAYALLLYLGPAVLSADRIHGPPASFGRGGSQNPHVAGSFIVQTPSVQIASFVARTEPGSGNQDTRTPIRISKGAARTESFVTPGFSLGLWNTVGGQGAEA